MTFSKVDFILAFAISFSYKTLQLRSLTGLVHLDKDNISMSKFSAVYLTEYLVLDLTRAK